MRKIMMAAALAAATLAAAEEPDPCEAWKVNGYQIGMTFTDALAVRQAKKSSMCGCWRTKDKTGVFFVGDDGRLDSWRKFFTVTADSAIIRAELEARYGFPTSQETITKNIFGAIAVAYDTTYWDNPECDARIALVFPKAVGSGGTASEGYVELRRLSTDRKEAGSVLD